MPKQRLSSRRLFIAGRTRIAVLGTLIVAAAIVGCSGDREAGKQRFMASGDRFAAEGKDREALIEYRNAVQLDPMFAEAQLESLRRHSRKRRWLERAGRIHSGGGPAAQRRHRTTEDRRILDRGAYGRGCSRQGGCGIGPAARERRGTHPPRQRAGRVE